MSLPSQRDFDSVSQVWVQDSIFLRNVLPGPDAAIHRITTLDSKLHKGSIKYILFITMFQCLTKCFLQRRGLIYVY